MSSYTFTLDLRVCDPISLYEAAFKHATQVDGLSSTEAKSYLTDYTEVDVEACLAMLLDPGYLDGCDIYGHRVDHYHAEFVDTDGDGL